MIDRFIQSTEPRMIVILLASILGLTLLASYLYVFKQPLATLQQKQQTLRLLEAEVKREMPLGQKIEELELQATDIKKLINASGQQLPQNQMIAYVIGQLDVIAANHRVQLVSVTPGKANKVFMFEELPFNIEIKGGYFDLYNWLKDVEAKLGPMVIKSFSMTADDKTGMRRLNTEIVSYLSTEDV